MIKTIPAKLFTGLFILGLSLSVSAQKKAPAFTASIDLQVAVPQGEYKENNSNVGLGGRLNVLWKPKEEVPFKFGIELGYQSYGSRSERFDAYVYGFYETYKVSASNNVVSLTFMPRLQVGKYKKIKPFIDGIFGWNVF